MIARRRSRSSRRRRQAQCRFSPCPRPAPCIDAGVEAEVVDHVAALLSPPAMPIARQPPSLASCPTTLRRRRCGRDDDGLARLRSMIRFRPYQAVTRHATAPRYADSGIRVTSTFISWLPSEVPISCNRDTRPRGRRRQTWDGATLITSPPYRPTMVCPAAAQRRNCDPRSWTAH